MPSARAQAATFVPGAPAGRSYLLPLGFGTTLMMWTIGFLSRIPPARLPSPALAALLLLTLLAGGFLAARRTGLGVRAGAEVGLVV